MEKGIKAGNPCHRKSKFLFTTVIIHVIIIKIKYGELDPSG